MAKAYRKPMAWIALICAVLVAFGCVLAAIHHDCEGENCLICATAKTVLRLFGGAMPLVGIVAGAGIAAFAAIAVYRGCTGDKTPVAMKTKLTI